MLVIAVAGAKARGQTVRRGSQRKLRGPLGAGGVAFCSPTRWGSLRGGAGVAIIAGSMDEAAQILGIDPATLYRKRKRYAEQTGAAEPKTE